MVTELSVWKAFVTDLTRSSTPPTWGLFIVAGWICAVAIRLFVGRTEGARRSLWSVAQCAQAGRFVCGLGKNQMRRVEQHWNPRRDGVPNLLVWTGLDEIEKALRRVAIHHRLNPVAIGYRGRTDRSHARTTSCGSWRF